MPAQQRKKTPEPKSPTPTTARNSGNVKADVAAPSSAVAVPGASAACEGQAERRASLTNVVRPMIQQPLQSASSHQQQQRQPHHSGQPKNSSFQDGTSAYSRPMQTLKPPQVDDTDTSTGGESPVLMRRRTYHSLKDTARQSLPARSCKLDSPEISIQIDPVQTISLVLCKAEILHRPASRQTVHGEG